MNTASAIWRFRLTVMTGAAEMERNLIREGTRNALAKKRRRGERPGVTPLGFRTTAPRRPMEPDFGELAAVYVILAGRRRRKPLPFRQIGLQLTAGRYRTKRGRVTTVKRIWVRRARCVGERLT